MAFGEAGHKMLENYQRYGTPIDDTKAWQFNAESNVRYPGKSAKKALKYVPAPKTGKAEHMFSMRVAGIEFIGKIDLEYEPKPGELWVLDYKFTSGFRNQKDESILANDVQATLYAAKTFIEHREIDEVHLRWLYILSTAKPSAKPTDIIITRDANRQNLRAIVAVAREMQEVQRQVFEAKSAGKSDEEIINSVEPSVSECDRYSGCELTDKCKLSQEQLIEGDMQMDQKLADLLAKRGIKLGGNAAPVQEQPAAQKPAAQNPPAAASKLDALKSKYVTKTEPPKKSKKPKGEPDVRLNAPEHYIDEPTGEENAEELVPAGCHCTTATRLSCEEKEQIIELFTKLIRAL